MTNEKLTSENGKEWHGRGVRVLVADDQRPTRQALAALLTFSPQPVNVVGEAADGEETVCMVDRLRPDVVVMDIRMPGMDGLEATRQIKCRWPEVRVVVLTMYPDYRSKAIAAGADAFVLKGGPVDALQNAITPVQDSVDGRHTV